MKAYPILAILAVFALIGCNTTSGQAPKVSYIQDKHLFAPGPEGGVDRIMLGDGMRDLIDLRVALGQYSQIMIDPIIVSHANKDAYDHLNSQNLKNLGEVFRITLADAVRDRYPLVTSRFAPETVRLTIALTGVEEVSVPGGLVRMDNASIEATLKDARTGQLLVAIIDSRSGKRDLSIPEKPDQHVQNAFEWWAQRLRHTMDTSRY